MKTEIMTITPKIAEKWIAATTFPNRNVSKVAVNRYAGEMSSGRWDLNGESIVIDDNGNVIDGQHRLFAVIKSGISIKSVVVFGVDSSTFATLDIGRKRSPGDVLGIAGYSNSRNLASAIRTIYAYKSGKIFDTQRPSGRVSEKRQDVLELVTQYKGVTHSVAWIAGRLKTCELLRPPSFAGAIHYLLGEQDTHARDAFFESIASGVPVYGDKCPTIALRKKYATIPTLKRMQYSLEYRFECWFSAWKTFKKLHDTEALQHVSCMQIDSRRVSAKRIGANP